MAGRKLHFSDVECALESKLGLAWTAGLFHKELQCAAELLAMVMYFSTQMCAAGAWGD